MTMKLSLCLIDCALKYLPDYMTSENARAMLLAIGLQESRLAYRKQIDGPAKSFLQFEEIGVLGVIKHPSSMAHFAEAMSKLEYGRKSAAYVHTALEYDQILAFVLGRLLLWTHADALPGKDQEDLAWQYYLELWRPGKPHPETWPGNYRRAWSMV